MAWNCDAAAQLQPHSTRELMGEQDVGVHDVHTTHTCMVHNGG